MTFMACFDKYNGERIYLEEFDSEFDCIEWIDEQLRDDLYMIIISDIDGTIYVKEK